MLMRGRGTGANSSDWGQIVRGSVPAPPAPAALRHADPRQVIGNPGISDRIRSEQVIGFDRNPQQSSTHPAEPPKSPPRPCTAYRSRCRPLSISVFPPDRGGRVRPDPAAKKIRGPTAVVGDQGSDLLLPGSGGRI